MKTSRFSIATVVLATAIAACASGLASADDNSMSRFGGDSYAYFNDQPIDGAPSAWRQENPHGLSDRLLQSLSSGDPVWQLPTQQAAADPAAPSFRQLRPNSLSFREMQALSSNSSEWQLPNASERSAMASTGRTQIAQSRTADRSFDAGSQTTPGR